MGWIKRYTQRATASRVPRGQYHFRIAVITRQLPPSGVEPNPRATERDGGPVSVARDSASLASLRFQPSPERGSSTRAGSSRSASPRPSIRYSAAILAQRSRRPHACFQRSVLGNDRLAVSAVLDRRPRQGISSAGLHQPRARNQYSLGAAQEPVFILTDFQEIAGRQQTSTYFSPDRYRSSRL